MAHETDASQCPKCGAVSTYTITMQNGGRLISCSSCRKNFTSEVKQALFTGKNR
ncbi:hypothetical protein Poly59_38740 [Rubripirellula reticaptiva]|uniref:Uncharacterized protein n=1 Tax=Rubripirellula reticaptiva TaxID=2528013 RepID=A0A5C6ELE2_9BACT|nr:hypothetical protein Poly59_38740 [Rubripirellula reticaptiva]